MPTLKLDNQEIKSMIAELKEQLLPDIISHIDNVNRLPPLLTRKEFMEVANIKDKKCNELFNRTDFPVTRELGHPRVVTEKLFDWLNKDIENRKQVNIDSPYLAI